MADLPVRLLPDAVEIAAPLDESQLIDDSIAGDYVFMQNFPAYTCDTSNGRVHADAIGAGRQFNLVVTDTGLRFAIGGIAGVYNLEQTGPADFAGTYVQNLTNGTQTTTITLEFNSLTEGLWTTVDVYDMTDCQQSFTRQARFEKLGE